MPPPVLKSLALQNLATIEAIEIDFAAGLNALTGETGAGKSILIGGLELALGARAAAETLRAGAKLATAEATFLPPAGGAFARPLCQLLTAELELEFDPVSYTHLTLPTKRIV